MAHPNPDPPFPEDQPVEPGPDIEMPDVPEMPQSEPFTGDPHDGRTHDSFQRSTTA